MLPARAPEEEAEKTASSGRGGGCSAQIGVKWNELLAVCNASMTTKNDIEMRRLIGTSVKTTECAHHAPLWLMYVHVHFIYCIIIV